MAARNYSNLAVEASLVTPITDVDTTFQVSTVTDWPAAPFTIVLAADTATEEACLVTQVVGTTLTVTRGYNGTVALPQSIGASVKHAALAIDFSEANDHVNASTNVHGVAGSVVGTSDSQTLTNKTLTSPTINAATVTGAVTATGSTVTGGTLTGQTITNGTLGSNLAAGGFKITGLADPASNQDAATKAWVDSTYSSAVASAAASATLASNWATQLVTPVSGGEYSAKYHAQAAASSAGTATTQAGVATTQAGNALASANAAALSESNAAATLAGAVTKATINAKGDLLVGTANDTITALTVGANDTILTADSAAAGGVKWATNTAIQPTVVDAKGDLIVATGADTVTRVPVSGNNGYVLTEDSTQASGVKWAASSGGSAGFAEILFLGGM